jgi:hypothetical protein
VASKKERAAAAKKREKRSKIALIAFGVVLLAVGVYEVPSVLKMMNRKAPGNTTYDPGPSTSVGGAPLPNVAAGASTTPAAPAVSKGDMIDTDVPLASAAGQLVTFEVFQTKNPFAPQVRSSQSGDASSSSSASPASPTTANKAGADLPSLPSLPSIPTIPGATTTTPALPGAGTTGSQGQGGVVPPTSGSTTTTPTTTSQTTTTAAPAPTVSISVNGVVSQVSTNGTFPTGAPVFRLEGYGHGTARIGIVGGSYQAGAATLTLRQGEPVTLENTTDSKRYTVKLLSTP